jgi:GT2 family glycosyltransferase
MNVSIIIPIFKPKKELLEQIRQRLKEQEFPGKIEILEINEGLGLADSMNNGIKKASSEIVVTLHQDCVPASKDWLEKLIEPFKDDKVVASVSKVELPKEFWRTFGLLAKIMTVKEEGVLTPLMDEKGCAYRKGVLMSAGLFDGKAFRTAGEDFDMWLKLEKLGKIAYPSCKVLHYHEQTLKSRIRKELQLSNGFGALVRIHGKEMPKATIGLLKAIPVLGWIIFLLTYPYRKFILGGFLWIPLALVVNFLYCFGFWKGLVEGRESI